MAAIDPVTAIVNLGSQLIDKIWPDPVKAAEAKLELIKLQQAGDLQEIAGQLAINQAEASNPSVFVSGWRPYVGWTTGIGLTYSFIVQPLLSWYSTINHFPVPPVLDLSVLITILGGLLGLGTMRTVEKINGVAAK